MTIWKSIVVGSILLSTTAFAAATDLTVHLKGSQPISRFSMRYECDAQGVKMGLPTTAFSVEYINGAGNSLAVVPIHGASLIFANVVSGSGARYAAGEYIWWDAAGRTTSLTSDSLAGTLRSECHQVRSR
ncbi:MAG: MliC family protein [Acidobacteriaceae bacterium]